MLQRDPSRAFASCWLRAFGDAGFLWTPESSGFPQLLAEDTVCTAALSRRDALEAVGGFDSDPRVDGYEDWDLAISLVENGYTGEIIPEFLFRYRIRPHSKSATRTTPENHASVVEYIVEKHAATYERHAPGSSLASGNASHGWWRGLSIRPLRPMFGSTGRTGDHQSSLWRTTGGCSRSLSRRRLRRKARHRSSGDRSAVSTLSAASGDSTEGSRSTVTTSSDSSRHTAGISAAAFSR